jgi:hypothetical protein
MKKLIFFSTLVSILLSALNTCALVTITKVENRYRQGPAQVYITPDDKVAEKVDKGTPVHLVAQPSFTVPARTGGRAPKDMAIKIDYLLMPTKHPQIWIKVGDYTFGLQLTDKGELLVSRESSKEKKFTYFKQPVPNFDTQDYNFEFRIMDFGNEADLFKV